MDEFIDSLCVWAMQQGASDIFLHEEKAPQIRLNGSLTPLPDYHVAAGNLNQFWEYCGGSAETTDLDAAVTTSDGNRFRVSLFSHMGERGAVLRPVKTEIPDLESLGLPENLLTDWISRPSGFILVTGPTGSGKSTTLASALQWLNMNQSRHVITIEDPIEYLFTNQYCIFTQREVGRHTPTFSRGLKSALRQSPDIIFLGEIRDSETAMTALQAAETGHLVIATLHSANSAETLDRLTRLFPPDERESALALLGKQLVGILNQHLLPDTQGHRIPVIEHFENAGASRNWIGSGDHAALADFIERGTNPKNVSFLHALVAACQNGFLDQNTARDAAPNPQEFTRAMKGMDSGSSQAGNETISQPTEGDISSYLSLAVEKGASDLHICSGAVPTIRVNGILRPLGDAPISSKDALALINSSLSQKQRARFENDWELDFALNLSGVGRFRGNVHYNRGEVDAAFRHIPTQIKSLTELGHKEKVKSLCGLEQGLILVTGITGSGKSSTLASMVKEIGDSRSGVIVTVEDPIEFIFENNLSIIKQREVGSDTKSFSHALKHVLRQDPDVIMVSELRDQETISAAVTAAETGHLVLGTLHTLDAPEAIFRIVDVFPGNQQEQIIAQLSNSLQAIISQKLLPREDEPGLALATEILVANSAVRSCIRTRKIEQVTGMIEIGQKDGMHTIDQTLIELYEQGKISAENALLHVRDKANFEEISSSKKKKRWI
ncbi:MAG: PilT/PilU family type 4a pilus ATPase [Verrucomicrobiota bacterium]